MTEDQLAIGGQLGPYLIDSVIGRGGMSVVYRARHSRLGMWVALKVLAPQLGSDDAFRERFLREAQMAASVDHPNVIPIHDMGVHEGSLYIVMRYVSGGDLKALLAGGSLDAPLTMRILAPVAQALDAAHVRGLVHRDVKPANVLIQRAPGGEIEHIYLTDFGIAKSSAALSGLTGTGVFIGTIEYMAPEQMEGREVSAQTDVYALGATVYQCLTGRLPFHRELAEGARPPVGALDPVGTTRPDLPAQLDQVLVKALAREPADRYASCGALMSACEQALAAGGALAAATPADAFQATELASQSTPSSAQHPAGAPAAVAVQAGTGAAATSPPGAGEAPPPGTPDGVTPGAGAPPPSDGPGQPRRRPPTAVLIGGLVVLAAVVVGVVLALGSSSSKAPGPAARAALTPVPANHVTGSGQVSVHLTGNKATVSLTTNGLDGDAELVHAMHIHAGGKGECPPASAAKPHNGHLAIDTNDGIAFYGPPVTSLTTSGNTSVASILVFKRYPVGGTIKYSRTIELPPKVAAEIRDNKAVIVIHGIDYDGSGSYTGVLDRSDLNKQLFATQTAPALCGPLKGTPQLADAGARSATYIAALHPTRLTVAELSICGVPLPENAADTRRRLPGASHPRLRTAA